MNQVEESGYLILVEPELAGDFDGGGDAVLNAELPGGLVANRRVVEERKSASAIAAELQFQGG